MPLYTYRCNDCDHLFEARQRMSDDPLSDCPACEGEVRRVINSVGVVFKGNGFYITDSRNGRSALNGTSSTNGNGVNGSDKAKEAKSESKTKTPVSTPAKADTKTAVAAPA